jgi:hypothetical protein
VSGAGRDQLSEVVLPEERAPFRVIERRVVTVDQHREHHRGYAPLPGTSRAQPRAYRKGMRFAVACLLAAAVASCGASGGGAQPAATDAPQATPATQPAAETPKPSPRGDDYDYGY